MSDQENGVGLLGGLLMGIGFASLIAAPFYIGYRFGLHILALLAAILATIYAIISPELVAAAYGMPLPMAQTILTLDKIGWWWMAGVMWGYAFLTMLVVASGWMPKALAGHK